MSRKKLREFVRAVEKLGDLVSVADQYEGGRHTMVVLEDRRGRIKKVAVPRGAGAGCPRAMKNRMRDVERWALNAE